MTYENLKYTESNNKAKVFLKYDEGNYSNQYTTCALLDGTNLTCLGRYDQNTLLDTCNKIGGTSNSVSNTSFVSCQKDSIICYVYYSGDTKCVDSNEKFECLSESSNNNASCYY